MNLSDRTISKWERGLGLPDISLLSELSQIFKVDIDKILLGSLEENKKDGGNMRNISFYTCPNCNNILFSTNNSEISCCGRKLMALESTTNSQYYMDISEIENDYYITIDHEMTKDNYISFIAYTNYDSIIFKKLYPEQNAEVRLPKMNSKKIYAYCTKTGLWQQDL
ncbi:RNase P subunit RPR2 [Bacilli bacterium PM5-3]|nr:RNase P subunit RPR2 [Bacilli bacterium PM5-3]